MVHLSKKGGRKGEREGVCVVEWVDVRAMVTLDEAEGELRHVASRVDKNP